MTHDATVRTSLSAGEVRAMLTTAAEWLRQNVSAINAINVFPVPDGDTGSNLSATLDAAVTTMTAAHVGDAFAALARGALMGARGNSGVILSQILRGAASALSGAERLDACRFAHALRSATDTAYRSVASPVEGTILSVVREASQAVSIFASDDSGAVPLVECLQAAVAAAQAAVARTPEQLPLLRQAGVVDAGGYGFSIILEGCLLALQGRPLPEVEHSPTITLSDWRRHHSAAHSGFGYCTEFLLRSSEVNSEQLRASLEALGESIVLAGEEDLHHIHVHTPDPGAALSLGTRLGDLQRIKVENMDAQRGMLDSTARAATVTSVIAVAAGAGLEQVLNDLGAVVVPGGQTMNPSTEELLRGMQRAAGAGVIVLPNNANIIWTAEQAASLSDRRCRVLPARSVPQGIAALLAYRPDLELDTNAQAMLTAMTAVHTIEITCAARAVSIDGIETRAGMPIALIDGELALAGASSEAAALTAVERVLSTDSSVITIYSGEGANPTAAARLAEDLRTRCAGIEVELLPGGQPFYPYLISVE